MQDRVSASPGRVLITPENGGEAYYATVERADNPTQEGTPLNKNSLLRDETEAYIFGSAANRTVDDAFYGIGNKLKLIMSNLASITVTVKDNNDKAVTNVLVFGMFDASGNDVYTDSNGVATGFVNEGSTTLKITDYGDFADVSKTVTAEKGASITASITVTRRNFLKVTASRNVRFSGDVTRVDATIVGGGGGGGDGIDADYTSKQAGGGGGGGGKSVIKTGIPFSANTNYQATIGAGGSPGASGGSSSFMGFTASGGTGGKDATQGVGGSGGSGGGAGGKGGQGSTAGEDGSNGTAGGYSSFTGTTTYGGGGGGGANEYDNYGAGGTLGGGAGGSERGNGKNGTANTGGGGGGGGMAGTSDEGLNSTSGGKGGSGVVAIRMTIS